MAYAPVMRYVPAECGTWSLYPAPFISNVFLRLGLHAARE